MSIVVRSDPIHRVEAKDGGSRKEYLMELGIKRSKPEHSMDVHVGDVVAIAAEPLSTEALDSWAPNHLLESTSKQWKVGMIVTLSINVSIEGDRYECRVQWLEKALDMQSAKDMKKINEFYRPYHKTNPKCRLPFLLLNSQTFEDSIDPLRILPAKITMLTSDQFPSGGIEWNEDPFSLSFCCAKKIDASKGIIAEDINMWADLNMEKPVDIIPKPVTLAWIQVDPNLVGQMIKKYIRMRRDLLVKHKQCEVEKIEAHKKERKTQKVDDKENSQPNKRESKSEEKQSRKRVRINEVNEGPSKTSSSRSKPAKSLLKSTIKAVSKNSKKATATTKTFPKKAKLTPTKRGRKPTTSNKKKVGTKAAGIKRKTEDLKTPVKKKKKDKKEQETPSVTQTPSTAPETSEESERYGPPIKISPPKSVLVSESARRYYDSVDISIESNIYSDPKIKPLQETFNIAIGKIVVVQLGGEEYKAPFCVEWSVAQVVSIWETKKGKFKARLRWFESYEEIMEKKGLSPPKDFKKTRSLLETFHFGDCEVETILAAHVLLTSKSTGGPRSSYEIGNDGLPIIFKRCQHLMKKDEKSIQPITDWTNYDKKISSLPGPLNRGLEQLSSPLRRKYEEEIQKRSCDQSIPIDGYEDDDETDVKVLSAKPISEEPIYDRWGMEFFEGINMDLNKDCFHENSTKPSGTFWTLKVGYIVPIRVDEDNNEDPHAWYPFTDRWNPGQIISIYRSKNGDSGFMMQVRWFDRFADLEESPKEKMNDLDKPHILFETEVYAHVSVDMAFPGRVIITSHDPGIWKVSTSHVGGIPLIPRLCGRICLDQEDIDNALDWTGYDISMQSLPDPLTRGLLLTPANRKNKEWALMLSRYYKKAIRQREPDPDEDVMRRWTVGRLVAEIDGESLSFDPQKTETKFGPLLCSEETSDCKRQFSVSLDVTVPLQCHVADSKATKRKNRHDFKTNLGDVICYFSENSGEPVDYIRIKHARFPWYPFKLSWSFGQILSIFRDDGAESSDQRIFVEIRRLYRASELPNEISRVRPQTTEIDCEEVYESDDIILLPASHLLGKANLFLGYQKEKHPGRKKSSEGSAVSCRCAYFFLSSHLQFHSIFSTKLSPASWLQEFKWRGMKLSQIARKFNHFRECSSTHLIAPTTFIDSCGLNLANALNCGSGGVVGHRLLPDKSDAGIAKYSNAMLPTNLANFEYFDLFYHDTGSLPDWTVSVGDFVAVSSGHSSSQPVGYPFGGLWKACEVLSIQAAVMNDDEITAESIRFEVRAFNVSYPNGTKSLPQISADSPSDETLVEAKDLLGPIIPLPTNKIAKPDWSKVPKHMPCTLCLADTSIFTHRGIQEDFSTVASPEPGSDSTENPSNGKIRIAKDYCHVDISRSRIYYRDFEFRSRSPGFSKDADEPQPWKVRMGDIVFVHCEGAKRYPFDCNWSVAEVIAIWREFSSADELEAERNSDIEKHCPFSMKVEVRWLYERKEIGGVPHSEASGDTDEVFESDHLDVVDAAEALLAPARLYHDPDKKPEGFRADSFLCRRFWSTVRKSLVPCGGPEGRQKRGWLYSENLPLAMQQHMRPGNSEYKNPITCSNLSWKEAMVEIMKKMTLKDASKGAYERGETLIGREKELSQISSFLRAAIGGAAGTGGVKSSIFIAGPPGVGKTACVRAALARLRSDQARGEIPAFNFVPLNGMEMRHPHEAYVKFWEALSGHKHVGSFEKACEKLEAHFTGPRKSSEADKDVCVVILDEIDYLVTGTQSVLYNFFDWPKRAAEAANGRRLVVIGISNTLNLADQLMPSVKSRVGSERISFKAYNYHDSVAILKSKIEDVSSNFETFDKDAIIFAAKKTAALSGDIRKAFQICKAAIEIVLKNYESDIAAGGLVELHYPRVKIGDVQKASRQSFNEALAVAVSYSTSFQALLLVSLATLYRSTGREVGGFDIKDIMTKMEALAGASGDPHYLPPPSFRETIGLLNQLGENNLLELRTETSTASRFRSTTGGSGGAWPMTSLKVDEYVLLKGLRNTPHKALAETNLPSAVC